MNIKAASSGTAKTQQASRPLVPSAQEAVSANDLASSAPDRVTLSDGLEAEGRAFLNPLDAMFSTDISAESSHRLPSENGGSVQLTNTVEASAEAQARRSLELEVTNSGVSVEQSVEVGAAAEVAAQSSVRQTAEDGSSMELTARGAARVAALARGNSHFQSTENSVALGFDGQLNAMSGVTGDLQFEIETINGSSLRATGSATAGASGGAGLNAGFARTRGQAYSAIDLGANGTLLAGFGLRVQGTVQDRDLAEASVQPLQNLAGSLNVVSELAGATGRVTESARQAANERQEQIETMTETPTGDFVTDFGMGTARNLHGAYTEGVNYADQLADRSNENYGRAGTNLERALPGLTDFSERVIGASLDNSITLAHRAYLGSREAADNVDKFLQDRSRSIMDFLS